MYEARDLFQSLPAGAQAQLRVAVNDNDPNNLRKLTRFVYPYVQTLEDAKGIAEFLTSETDLTMRNRREPVHHESSQPDVLAGGVMTGHPIDSTVG